mgnify:CR=1 FL=1
MPIVDEVCRILYENTPAKKSLRRLLKKAGYYVGYIGKWGVGQPPQDLFVRQVQRLQ